MSNSKSPKSTNNRKSNNKKKESLLTRIRQLWKTKDDISSQEQQKHKKNTYFLTGFLIFLLAISLLLAMVSHLFTSAEDQLLLNDESRPCANWLGRWGYISAHYLMDNWFGVASIFIPIILFATSVRVMNITRIRLHKWFLNCMILMIWISAFSTYIVEFIGSDSYIVWGGMIGHAELAFLKSKIGPIGVPLLFLATVLLYLAYVSEETITAIRQMVTLKNKEKEAQKKKDSRINDEGKDSNNEHTEETAPFEDSPSDTATTIDFAIGPKETEGEEKWVEDEAEAADDTELHTDKDIEAPTLPTLKETEMEIIRGNDPERANEDYDGMLEPYDPKLDLEYYKYPTLDLLKKVDNSLDNVDMTEQTENKDRIIRVLSNFGVEIVNIKATIGPTITLYEIKPAPKVRIAKIRNLEDDIALSLSALGIRIIAPIPGKGTIGIEVPNAKPKMVSMESILNSRKFQESDFELPLAIGKTITNEVFMVDLAKMPHLLVAGATGQGKSVGLNCIITSLLYKKHPAELKLVMVDPKKVEFSVYSPIINHFLAQVEGNEDEEPIITDVNKVIQTLKSLCVEMDSRYDLLKRARARNLKEYNQKFKNRELNPNNGHRFMPYIVVIIDEFGDLIMTAGKEIELPIARIAQLARAVGIHMIIATQRPTTNIITGTIKANFPARMAFKVTSVVDSRTILDRTGANQLVGKGDMLIISNGEPVRVQCAFVDTPEVENICNYIAVQQSYDHPYPLPEVPLEGSEEGNSSDIDMSHLDPMFEEVARMVVTEQSGSTSMIQRKFSIGFNRAGRLMDQLEKAGIVGPTKGSKPREVLCISEEDLTYKLNNLR